MKDTRGVVSTTPETLLTSAADLLQKYNIGALLVLDEDEKLAGIISERDIIKSLALLKEKVIDCTVSEVMTTSVITCSPEDDAVEMLALMNKNNFRHMPVVRDGKPLKMISIREFDTACRHLQLQSRTDELTGLANRRHFMDMFSGELNRQRRHKNSLSVAMLDIDLFKQINDQFGHNAGDDVLRELADILMTRLRGCDIIGRLGGEEFAILLPDTQLDDATRVCQELAELIRSKEVLIGRKTIKFTASFGVTEVVDLAMSCEEILNIADKLLYTAKETGRDKVVSDFYELRPASNM